MEILKVEGISKTFGTYRAVNNVSFTVEEGRIFGLLGPNGAGKTTTIRMITNILYPDSGKIEIMGKPTGAEMQNILGYLPEERGLYKKLKVIDQLIYFARLKQISRADAIKRSKEWLAKMGASGWENKKIEELSKGMQQKVQFISTILHDPPVMILDEPFSGFDPINTELLKSVILEMKQAGKTIILSTHVMAQVEQMCDDLVLINKGNVVLSGGVRQVKASYGKNTVVMEYDGDPNFLKEIDGIKINDITSHRVEFKLEDPDLTTNQILQTAMNNNVTIYKFEKVEPSLHEIFIEVVGQENMKGAQNEN
ncbi:MAG: ATP-binding cassette domain-containing protein [Candidatus Kapabacteria bacterium]|nr:ATP-binding cassette domain-containing protein [Ignavibacteriota bacterium]MCW5884144.1 ATP-binding cassette domain-containing protein [Candidatus Kapabacteria bacterium]